MDLTVKNSIFSSIVVLLVLLIASLIILNYQPPLSNCLDDVDDLSSSPKPIESQNIPPIGLIEIKANSSEIFTIEDPPPYIVDPSDFAEIVYNTYKQYAVPVLVLGIGIFLGFSISRFSQSKSILFTKATTTRELSFKQVCVRIFIPMLLLIYYLHGYFSKMYKYIWNSKRADMTISDMARKIFETGLCFRLIFSNASSYLGFVDYIWRINFSHLF